MGRSIMDGTSASSQIVFLEKRVKELEAALAAAKAGAGQPLDNTLKRRKIWRSPCTKLTTRSLPPNGAWRKI